MADDPKTQRLVRQFGPGGSEEVTDAELVAIQQQFGRRFAASYTVEPLQVPKPDDLPPSSPPKPAAKQKAGDTPAASDAGTPAA